MIEQQGQVEAVVGHKIRVRLGGRSGCAACEAGRGCGAGVFGRMFKREPVLMEFENQLEASCGQAVVVGLPDRLFLGLVVRLYLLPLLAGLAGAVAGHYMSLELQIEQAGSDAMTLIVAVLAGSLVFWRYRKKPLEFPGASAVHLLRVVEKQ